MTSQQDTSGAHGEEPALQNPSPNLSEKAVQHKVRPRAFERSGGLRTAVIVMAVLYIATEWLDLPITSQLTAGGTTSGSIAYNVWMALLLLVLVATFVIVGLWLGRARRNADRIAPDQQRLSRAWVWLGWIVPIVNFWFPKKVIDDIWRSTVRNPAKPRTGRWWGTFIAAHVLSTLVALFPTALSSIGAVVTWLLASVTMTVAGVFWIRVARTISDAQDALAVQSPSHTRV